MVYKSNILVPKKEMEAISRILENNHYHPDNNCDEIIKTYTAKFANGMEVDIKICGGHPPYVDAVLFDENGNERGIIEADNEWLGEYIFYLNEDQYQVTIASAPNA